MRTRPVGGARRPAATPRRGPTASGKRSISSAGPCARRARIGAMQRSFLAALVAALLAFAAIPASAQPQKVLRYAFEIAETSFDPQRISDVYSNIVNQGMFDAPLTYDYLAQPAKLKPNTATSLPEISADGTTYTLHVRPGIYFADDPAFGGRKRELVAADYIYSMKRMLDPKVRASQISEIEPYVVGAEEAANAARKANRFD